MAGALLVRSAKRQTPKDTRKWIFGVQLTLSVPYAVAIFAGYRNEENLIYTVLIGGVVILATLVTAIYFWVLAR